MMKNKAPFDANVVQKAAGRIETLAPMIPDTFVADTRKAGVKTRAREGIWTNMTDYKAKSDELARAAAALTAAAKTGDKGATMKAAGAVGKGLLRLPRQLPRQLTPSRQKRKRRRYRTPAAFFRP